MLQIFQCNINFLPYNLFLNNNKLIFISNCFCKRNSLVLFVNVRVISGYLQHVINVVVERYNFFHCKNKNKVSFFTPIHAVSLSLSLSTVVCSKIKSRYAYTEYIEIIWPISSERMDDSNVY